MGTYSSNSAATSIVTCLQCPRGSWTPYAGASSISHCQLCDKNYFEAEQVKCKNCSVGTYGAKNTPCCPLGAYEVDNSLLVDVSTCVECMPGTFTATEGSTRCKLCSSGTYNPKTAASSCVKCPLNSICPIGSQKPIFVPLIKRKSSISDPFFKTSALPMSSLSGNEGNALEFGLLDATTSNEIINNMEHTINNNTMTLLQTIPNPFAATESQQMIFVIVIVSCLIAALLVFMTCSGILIARFKKLRALLFYILSSLDFFSMMHPVQLNEPLIRTKNVIGGIFSLIFVAITIGFLFEAATSISRENNVLVTTTLIPSFSLPVEIRGMTEIHGSFKLHITLYGLLSNSCIPTSSDIQGIDVYVNSAAFKLLTTETNVEDSTCLISFVCSDCTLTSSNPILTFSWKHPFAAIAGFEYSLEIPHFLEVPVIVNQQVFPQSMDTVIRGSKASQVSVALFSTYYSYLGVDYFFYHIFSRKSLNTRTQIGYSCVSLPTTIGSTATESTFSIASDSENIVTLQFSLQVNPNVLRINESAKLSLLDFLAKLVALIGAAYSVSGRLLTVVEPFTQKLCICIKRKKKSSGNNEENNKIEGEELVLKSNDGEFQSTVEASASGNLQQNFDQDLSLLASPIIHPEHIPSIEREQSAAEEVKTINLIDVEVENVQQAEQIVQEEEINNL